VRFTRVRHDLARRESAHAAGLRLRGGHAQRHLVLLERDDENFQIQARNRLFLNPEDTPDAMRGIDNVIARLECGLSSCGIRHEVSLLP
jgi:hypothetical protein